MSCKLANAVCSRDCLSNEVVSGSDDAAVAAISERLDEDLGWLACVVVVELVGSARCLVCKVQSEETKVGLGMSEMFA